MTGWRLGYLAAPKPFASACLKIQSQVTALFPLGAGSFNVPSPHVLLPKQSTSGASSIAQRAALAAFQLGFRGGAAVGEMVAAFKQRRDFLVTRLQAVPGIHLDEPQGAFYVFPKVSSFFGTTVEGFGEIRDSDSLCMYLLQEAQVCVVLLSFSHW